MANEILADKEYKYDPDHKNKPLGGGWEQTPSGWTTKKHQKQQENHQKSVEDKYYSPHLKKMMNNLGNLEKYVKRNDEGLFILDEKDWERIDSIVKRAGGDKSKIYRYSINMANAITDPAKAVRRGIAAYSTAGVGFGMDTAIAVGNIFFIKALGLTHSTKQISDINTPQVNTKPPKFRKMNPKLPASLHYLIKDNDLNPDEVEELTGFKNSIMAHPMMSDKEFKNRVENGLKLPRNQQQLKNSFVKNMDPRNYDSMIAFQKAKERIQKMTVADFGKLLGAIMAEEET